MVGGIHRWLEHAGVPVREGPWTATCICMDPRHHGGESGCTAAEHGHLVFSVSSVSSCSKRPLLS